MGHFLDGPLDAAVQLFSRRFDESPAADDEGLIRYWITGGTFFPPIVFYAGRRAGQITILDYEADDDYWELIADDPVN